MLENGFTNPEIRLPYLISITYLSFMKNEFQQVPWIRNTNVYEVNLRQYTKEGTLASFMKHLPRLHDMGVDVLWFMPLTPISQKNKKGSLGSYYACASYTKLNPEFGTIKEFQYLVKEAHQLGMKVIIDWVANHTGCDHEWTVTNPSYYKINEVGEFYDSHGWDDVIDLNYENQEMRIDIIRAMSYWIDTCEIDGFRCDMAMLTPVDFWFQARTALSQYGPLFWLAELDPLDDPAYMEVFDAAYTWRWMNTAKDFKQTMAKNIHPLQKVLEAYRDILPPSASPAWFTSNHDENSWNGTEYEKYAEMATPLAVFSSMWKGLPLLYSGQELPNLKRLNFFDKDQIEWVDHPKLHLFYKKLFSFRKSNKVFNALIIDQQCFVVINSVDHHILSFIRKAHDFEALILINFSEYNLQSVEVQIGNARGVFQELFSSSTEEFEQNQQYFDFEPWGYQVWFQ